MSENATVKPFAERAERFLLLPPVEATFGTMPVNLGDISVSGARLRHSNPIEAGSKSFLRFKLDGAVNPVALEGEVVWTQPSLSADLQERHVSGVRLQGSLETIERVVARLMASGRSHRVRERRFSDRFMLHQALRGELDGAGEIRILDLASKGARIETTEPIGAGEKRTLRFPIPKSTFEVRAGVEVAWCRLSAIYSATEFRHHVGLRITERPELIRLAIGQLSELRLATKDTLSLKLKLKIARAFEKGPGVGVHTVDDAMPGSEYFPLIQSVRTLLASDPEECKYWMDFAAKTAEEPDIRARTGPITKNHEALAAWEYLDRTIDASIVALAFEKHKR